MPWRTIDDDMTADLEPASAAWPKWISGNCGSDAQGVACAGGVSAMWPDGTGPTFSTHPEKPGVYQMRLDARMGLPRNIAVSIRYKTATATAGGSVVVRVLETGESTFASLPANTTDASVDIDLVLNPTALPRTVVTLAFAFRSAVGDEIFDTIVFHGSEQAIYYDRSPLFTTGAQHMLIELPDITTVSGGGSQFARHHICACDVYTASGSGPDGVLYVWPPLATSAPLIPNNYDATKSGFAQVWELGTFTLKAISAVVTAVDVPPPPVPLVHQGMIPAAYQQLATRVMAGSTRSVQFSAAPGNDPPWWGSTATAQFAAIACGTDSRGVTVEIQCCPVTPGVGGAFDFLLEVLDPAGVVLATATQSTELTPLPVPEGAGSGGSPTLDTPLAPLDVRSGPLLPWNIAPQPGRWGAADTGSSETLTTVTLTARGAPGIMTAGTIYIAKLTNTNGAYIRDVVAEVLK